jgi:hypothetical protein
MISIFVQQKRGKSIDNVFESTISVREAFKYWRKENKSNTLAPGVEGSHSKQQVQCEIASSNDVSIEGKRNAANFFSNRRHSF